MSSFVESWGTLVSNSLVGKQTHSMLYSLLYPSLQYTAGSRFLDHMLMFVATHSSNNLTQKPCPFTHLNTVMTIPISWISWFLKIN